MADLPKIEFKKENNVIKEEFEGYDFPDQNVTFSLCQVKTEPESDNEQHCEQTSTEDYPLNITAIKQEFIDEGIVYMASMEDELNPIERSDGEAETYEHNSTISGNAIVKSEHSSFLDDAPHSDTKAEYETMSGIAEEKDEQQVCTKNVNKRLSNKERIIDFYKFSEECYKCSLCGKVLQSKHACLSHISYIHSDTRPHVCDICGKAFKHTQGLKCHKKYTHSDERPYSCDVCGKSFKKIRTLKSHKDVIHSNKRPYLCDICGNGFKTPFALKVHMSSLHNGGKYSCDICGRTFHHVQYLESHKKAIHANKKTL